MQIEQQYEQLLETSLARARSGEPVSFIGMYDCGKNYTFGLLAERISKSDNLPKMLLIGALGNTEQEWLQNIISELTILGWNQNKEISTFQDVEKILRRTLVNESLCWVLNLGYQVKIPIQIIEMWQRLRDLYGAKFSYQIYANSHLLFDKCLNQNLFDKIIRRDIIRILPLNVTDANTTLLMYEARFGHALSDCLHKEVISLSGGNPGLLKSLYLQAIESKGQNEWWNIQDGRLHYRLERIVNDLPKEYQKSLVTKDDFNTEQQVFLKQFGYKNSKGEIFSPLIQKYFTSRTAIVAPILSGDELATIFTVTERKVYKLLENMLGAIVNRETIASSIWGDNWNKKYSDWAIDQVMSQLRKKLVSVSKLGELKTKRGEGYILLRSSH